MTLSQDLSLHNPVARVEHEHLRRAMPARHPALKRVLMGAVAIFLLVPMSVFFFCLDWAAGQNPVIPYPIPAGMQRVAILLAVATLVIHFRVLFKTSVIASNTVLREKLSGTWETLILTDVGARQLVLGKWWAVVCMVWKNYALLAILRAGAVAGIGTMLFPSKSNYALWYSRIPAELPEVNILLAAAIIAVFTLLNGLFTAAAGVVGSFLGRIHSPGVTTAVATRGTAAMIPIVLLLTPIVVIFLQYEPPVYIDQFGTWPVVVIWTLVSLVDNGTLLTSMLSNPLDSVDSAFFLAVIFAFVIYAILILGLLRFGMFIARRQGASA